MTPSLLTQAGNGGKKTKTTLVITFLRCRHGFAKEGFCKRFHFWVLIYPTGKELRIQGIGRGGFIGQGEDELCHSLIVHADLYGHICMPGFQWVPLLHHVDRKEQCRCKRMYEVRLDFDKTYHIMKLAAQPIIDGRHGLLSPAGGIVNLLDCVRY